MEQKTTIRFMSNVDDQSVRLLINLVENEFKSGIKNFRIIISSPGGYVDPGISAFNYLKCIPAEIETVNFGSVDSISVVIFCAGTKRISVPNARFIIHDIFRITPSQSINLSEIQLLEWINSTKKDRKNIAKIISDTCKLSITKIEAMMKKGYVLDPNDAKKLGLVQTIEQELIEDGSKVLSIN